jgi:hypothetical protein
MTLPAGITRGGESLDAVHWNILGQVYSPLSVSPDCFAWHALLPTESFVPPHIHTTQDEFIQMLEGRLDLTLDGREMQAGPGDLVRMPRGIPHGIFNNSGQDVRCLFWVAPTGRLVDLFRRLHNLSRPDRVVAVSRAHEVVFLAPVRAAEAIGASPHRG